MKISRISVVRALVFLLLVTPLQAQQVFACGMMGTTFFDDCCCEHHNNCADADCSDATSTETNQCCKQSVELNISNEMTEDLIVIKSLEIRSNIDPPPAITFTLEQLVEPVRFTEISYLHTTLPGNLGSNTYFITQRLRI